MADTKQVIFCIFILLQCKGTICTDAEVDPPSKETTQETLVESESKDGKLEIIKQIKKVNDDGSYTIGYEADDGTFKIESRDVLGNIKGTYGFIDDEGQIKRVSYSTSNSSEVLTKTDLPSVVQRIPNKNKTIVSTTRKPSFSTTTLSPSTTTPNVIQSIARRRAQSSSTTTPKPNYSAVINVGSEISKTTTKPNHIVYTSAAPKVLLQGRPILRSTPATHTQTQKSEGQLIRPEIASRPTELPLFRRLALQHPLLEDGGKPVIEEPEVRSNILRRQLSQEKSGYDIQEHVFSLQQGLGDDATDVYSSSVTTGTPRPLFTTTLRPKYNPVTSTTAPIAKPTIRYPLNYQRNVLQDVQASTPEYTQESSTTESTLRDSTPTSVPIVQIPANRATPETLVAIRHPHQRGTILVPLSQLQGRIIPVENLREINDGRQDYVDPNGQYIEETTPKPVEIGPRPIYLRRLPPPHLRPMPVHVDENGYIREVPQHIMVPTPYPLPIPITPVPKYVNNNVENDIDEIEPPVSTRDFQKLLQQLISRQSRLEKISKLTDPRLNPEVYQPKYRHVYHPTPAPYFIQRNRDPQEYQQNGPVQFITTHPDQNHPRQKQFISVPSQNHEIIARHPQRNHPYHQIRREQQQQQQNTYVRDDDPQSYVPTRRVARLLPSMPQQQQLSNGNEQYLPPDVREMLLLRMLQLAINPALPVDDEDAEATTSEPQYKKAPVRNVEILGEERDDAKRPMRMKRYKQSEEDYY